MNKRTFVLLVLLLAGLAGATALFLYMGASSRDQVRLGEPLFENLDLNAIEGIKVESPENIFTIVKADGKWEVVEKGGYPADFDKIARFARKLNSLNIGRAFEKDAESLARLQLKLPDTPGASKDEMGVRFTLSDNNGKELVKLLAGRDREKMTPEGYPVPAGQYVRVGDMESILLINRFFESVKQYPSDWLKKSIVRVDSSSVESIACMEIKDGKQKVLYELSRKSPDEGLSLADGRAVKKTDVDKLADALSSLTLDDVTEAEKFDQPMNLIIDYWLFNGVKYRVFKTSSSGECQVKIEVSYQAPASAEEKSQEVLKAEKEEAQKVEELNAKLAPWVYTISKWRCGTLAENVDSLLEEEKEGE